MKIKAGMKRINGSFLKHQVFVAGIQMTGDLIKSTSNKDLYLPFWLTYNKSTKSEVFLIKIPTEHHKI